MSLMDNAIATYEAAARMVSRLLDSRTDLLADGLSSLSSRPSLHLGGGYKDIGASLGVCLPAESRATMSRLPLSDGPVGASPAVEVLTADIEWMTFEGWLSDPRARVCFVEIGVDAERPITADVFLRCIGPDGEFLSDSAPVEWRLPLNGPAVLEVPLTCAGEGRRKMVIHLRRPPERMILRRLAITTLP